MKKIKLVLFFLMLTGLLAMGLAFAQEEGGSGNIDYGAVEDESGGRQSESDPGALYKISLDTFEAAGEWMASIPLEFGLAQVKEIPGSPLELKGKEDTVKTPPKYGMSGSNPKTYFEEEKDEHKQVLGVKVSFMKRAAGWIRINPPFPTKLEGLVRGFEVWVCGRNKQHTLHLVLRDFYGQEKYLEVGQLNFMGWKKMNVQIPYTIVQEDFRFSVNRGLTFEGLMISFNTEESVGRYYVYFDNLSAEISRFLEENRDTDDPLDVW